PLHRAPLRVDEQLLITRASVQFALEGPLDAGLPGQRRARVLLDRQPLLVLFADRADIADRMYARAAVRVIAGEARFDLYPGKLMSPCREARELLLGQLELDRDRIEAAPAADVLLECRNGRRLDQLQLRETLQRLIEIGDLLARELQLIRRGVRRERHAIAVEDQAAI